MSKHESHLMHRKLLALGSLAQYSLQKLICHMSLEIVKSEKDDKDSFNEYAAKAVSEVLSRDVKNLGKITKSFTEPNSKGVIFRPPDYKDVNEKVYAEHLDTSALVGLLLKVKNYPVSYPKNRASVACQGYDSIHANHADCCQPSCQFLCKNCVNVNCVCCETCRMCMKCILKHHGLKDWQELIVKLVLDEERIDVCSMLLLRLSILLIKLFRNFMCHLTAERRRNTT